MEIILYIILAGVGLYLLMVAWNFFWSCVGAIWGMLLDNFWKYILCGIIGYGIYYCLHSWFDFQKIYPVFIPALCYFAFDIIRNIGAFWEIFVDAFDVSFDSKSSHSPSLPITEKLTSSKFYTKKEQVHPAGEWCNEEGTLIHLHIDEERLITRLHHIEVTTKEFYKNWLKQL